MHTNQHIVQAFLLVRQLPERWAQRQQTQVDAQTYRDHHQLDPMRHLWCGHIQTRCLL